MGDTVEAVLQQLHSFKGISLNEDYKYLSSLLNRLTTSKPNDSFINSLLSCFDPQNDFERIARMGIINRFKCVYEVINAFKSNDLYQFELALKCTWFFTDQHDLLSDIGSFISDVFSHVSVCHRRKFLNHYAVHLKDSTKADRLFNCVFDRYGYQCASVLLPACSQALITGVICDQAILGCYLPGSICHKLTFTYPTIIHKYLMLFYKQENRERSPDYALAMHTLASVNMAMFIEIFEAHHKQIYGFTLGRKLTARLVKVNIQSVVSNSTMYCKILSLKPLLGSLSREKIQQFHLGLMPKTIDSFKKTFSFSSHISHQNVLRQLSQEERQRILQINFEKTYGRPVGQSLDDIPNCFVEFLSPDLRAEWARIRIMKAESQDLSLWELYSYLPTEESIPKLQKLIQSESDPCTRVNLAQIMFESLRINSKIDEVPQLVKYIVDRFRNDTVLLRDKVFDELERNEDLEKLEPNSWTPIVELIGISLVGQETRSGTAIVSLLKKCMYTKLRHNLSIETEFQALVRYDALHHVDGTFNFSFTKGSQIEKKFLLWVMNGPLKRNDSCRLLFGLFCTVLQWNDTHKDKIVVPDWLFDEMVEIVKSESLPYYRREDMRQRILKALKRRKDLRASFLVRTEPEKPRVETFLLLMDSDPHQALSKLKPIVEVMLEDYHFGTYNKFIQRVRLLHAFNLQVSSQCLSRIVPVPDERRRTLTAIRAFALLKPLDFANLARQFHPTAEKVTGLGDDFGPKVVLQQELAMSLHLCRSPLLVVDSLAKFAVGDYLKFVVPSLQMTFRRIGETKALEILSSWMDTPVSLRKHLIRAYSLIAPIRQTIELVLSLFEKEKNYSIREILFSKLYSSFVMTPIQVNWSGVKSAILKFDLTANEGELPRDKKLLDFILEVIPNTPVQFVSELIELVWNILDRPNIPDQLVIQSKVQIVYSVTKLNSRFTKCLLTNESFCNFLADQLLKSGNFKLDQKLMEFVVVYLLHCPSAEVQSDRVSRVLPKIIKMLLQEWEQSHFEKKSYFPSHQLLRQFVSELCQQVNGGLNLIPLCPEGLLCLIFENLQSSFEDPTQIAILLLKMKLTIQYVKDTTKEKPVTELIDHLSEVINEFCSTYGGEHLDTIAGDFLSVASIENSSMIDTIGRLVDNPSRKYSLLLAMRLLPSSISDLHDKENMKKYQFIFEKLKSHTHPSVKVALSTYICTLTN